MERKKIKETSLKLCFEAQGVSRVNRGGVRPSPDLAVFCTLRLLNKSEELGRLIISLYLEFSRCISAPSCFPSFLSFFLSFFLVFLSCLSSAALSLNEVILYALLRSKALASVKGRMEILCSPRPLWVPPAWNVDSDGRQIIIMQFLPTRHRLFDSGRGAISRPGL